jgi:hypothetical protein
VPIPGIAFIPQSSTMTTIESSSRVTTQLPDYPKNESECLEFDFYDTDGITFTFDQCIDLITKVKIGIFLNKLALFGDA